MLEAYVLGALSEAEYEQVAGAICRFPDVATEVASLEEAMFREAELGAIAPPPALEDQIWAVLEKQPAQSIPQTHKSIPLPPPAATSTAAPVPAMESQVIRKRFPIGMAAAVALLVASLAGNYIIYKNGQQKESTMLAAQTRLQSELQDRESRMQSMRDELRNEAEIAASPDMQPVAMRSLKPGEPMAATMYWNAAKHQAYVAVHKLPPAPQGMQYQLWAIADGKPVSLGMIRSNVAAEGGMQPVELPVAAGQAFAVSLEKEGGVPSPTAERIMLMGKVPA